MNVYCGIDWAEGHHDVALIDDDGTVLATRRVDTGSGGFTDLVGIFAEHGYKPTEVVVAIETDKNLLVVALQAVGVTVYAINPRAVARYRERYRQAGGKSDSADALVLANIMRTDRHIHRPLPAISEQGLAVRALARQHQEAIWARQVTVNRMRSLLLEFYPAALRAFPSLTHKATLTILKAAPTPAQGAGLTRRRIVALLRQSGRGNRPGLAEKIQAALRSPQLCQTLRSSRLLAMRFWDLWRWFSPWRRPSPSWSRRLPMCLALTLCSRSSHPLLVSALFSRRGSWLRSATILRVSGPRTDFALLPELRRSRERQGDRES